MDQFRQAKCTQCAASFKVPATFTASKAKCPKCGGVVEVGEVQGAAPKAEASTPKPVPASVPAAKPAAAATPKPAAAPAAAKPAAPKPAAAAPVAKPAAAAAKPAAPSVRSAAESAASKVKAGGAAKPAAKKGKEEDGDGEKHERKRHVPTKKSSMPALIGLVAMLVFAGAAYWYFGMKLPAEEKAKHELEAAATAKRLADQAEQAAKDKAEMDAANAGHNADLAGAAAAKGEDVAVPDVEVPAEKTAKEAEAPAKKPDAAHDSGSDKTFEEIDLTALPVLPKYSKSTDEEWDKYQADAKLLTDPASGAAGNRAGKRIEEAGRAAVPALLNQFRTINPAVEDGFRAGDLIQKMLERICKGMNFGWKYSTEPKDVYYNKKAIQSWFKQWEKVGEDDAAWAKFTKQDAKKAAGDAEGGDAPATKPASGLDDF